MHIGKVWGIIGTVAGTVGAVAGASYAWQEAKWPGLATTNDVAKVYVEVADVRAEAENNHDQLAADLQTTIEKIEKRTDGLEKFLLLKEKESLKAELANYRFRLSQDPGNSDLRALVLDTEAKLDAVKEQLDRLRQ